LLENIKRGAFNLISISDLKKGMIIEYKNEIYTIINYQHVKVAMRGALIRTNLKNIRTGLVIEKTFKPVDKMEQVMIDRKTMQYLYRDGDNYYFMNKENYEQTSLSKEQLSDLTDLLKEGNDVDIIFYKEMMVGAELPNFINLKVTKTMPGVKGNTVSGAFKPATLETGAIIQVPLFVKEGDVVKIDTRERKYLERE
jgi:elongation factor P